MATEVNTIHAIGLGAIDDRGQGSLVQQRLPLPSLEEAELLSHGRESLVSLGHSVLVRGFQFSVEGRGHIVFCIIISEIICLSVTLLMRVS